MTRSFKWFFRVVLAACLALVGCVEALAPVEETTGDAPVEDEVIPSLEDDLIAETPGGKFDTGYLSTLSTELEATVHGQVQIDVSGETPEDRQTYADLLLEDASEIQSLVRPQVKFAKNQVNAVGLHLNLSAEDVQVADVELSDAGMITVSYTTSVETIISFEEIEELGTTLEELLERDFSAVVPAQPNLMYEKVGAACLEEGAEAHDYNYFYYYEPEREGCAEAMEAAGISQVRITLDLRDLAPSKSVFPEYDQLVADGRIDAVAFFGAADHDWEPGEWDWGTYSRDQFVRALTSRGFTSTHTDEGDVYTRTVGELVESIRVIGPEVLKLLKEDTDGLFQRHVSANEIVFYNGHSFYGSLSVLDDEELYPGSYQIFFINSCWSYEYYTKQMFQHNVTEEDPDGWLNVDVVNDTESGWFHNMAAESRILFFNLLEGAENGGVDGDRYYTWDRIIGAMNEYAIAQQASRGSKSHEIYGVSGVRTNQFDPTAVVEPEPDTTTTYSGAGDLAIPDNDEAGASQSLEVPQDAGTVGTLTVRAEIEHTYVSDLTVTLRKGDTYLTLHGRTGGSSDDLNLDLTTEHFSGLEAAGTWTLEVVDSARIDTGSVISWSIEL